jgi:hypothetical protein
MFISGLYEKTPVSFLKFHPALFFFPRVFRVPAGAYVFLKSFVQMTDE